MATNTRLSTMESANESARHAVIAMLHALLRPAGPEPTYNGQGKLLGEMPRLFDPEEHELDDTLPLKRLDATLFEQEAPHFLDILKVEEMINQLPDLEAFPPSGDELMKLLSEAGGQTTKDWSFTEMDEIQNAVQAAVAALVGIKPPTP